MKYVLAIDDGSNSGGIIALWRVGYKKLHPAEKLCYDAQPLKLVERLVCGQKTDTESEQEKA